MSLPVVPLSRQMHRQISVFTSISVKNHGFILIPSILVYHYFLAGPFPSQELNRKKPSCHYSQYIYSFVQARYRKGSFRIENSCYCERKTYQIFRCHVCFQPVLQFGSHLRHLLSKVNKLKLKPQTSVSRLQKLGISKN